MHSMVKGSCVLLAAIVVSGCAVSSAVDMAKDRIADRAGSVTDAYCNRYTGDERSVVRDRFDRATYPHRLRVECDVE